MQPRGWGSDSVQDAALVFHAFPFLLFSHTTAPFKNSSRTAQPKSRPSGGRAHVPQAGSLSEAMRVGITNLNGSALASTSYGGTASLRGPSAEAVRGAPSWKSRSSLCHSAPAAQRIAAPRSLGEFRGRDFQCKGAVCTATLAHQLGAAMQGRCVEEPPPPQAQGPPRAPKKPTLP